MTREATWAVEEMADCAVAMRGDWDRAEVYGKLTAMLSDRLHPCAALIRLAQVMREADSWPADIATSRAAVKSRRIDPAESEALAELHKQMGWQRPGAKAS
jgi:hypothetical protein